MWTSACEQKCVPKKTKQKEKQTNKQTKTYRTTVRKQKNWKEDFRKLLNHIHKTLRRWHFSMWNSDDSHLISEHTTMNTDTLHPLISMPKSNGMFHFTTKFLVKIRVYTWTEFNKPSPYILLWCNFQFDAIKKRTKLKIPWLLCGCSNSVWFLLAPFHEMNEREKKRARTLIRWDEW